MALMLTIVFTLYTFYNVVVIQSLKDDNDCKEKCKNLEGDNLFEGCNDGVLLWLVFNENTN